MKEDLIKQNAEEYADAFCSRDDQTGMWQECCNIFIAGAHSRDEEISQWELAYNNLLYNFNERGSELAKLSIELNKLRNPWISVEERLPSNEDYDDDNICCFLVRQECGYIYNCVFDGEEWLTTAPDGEEWGVCGVAHWMPIPKGGEK